MKRERQQRQRGVPLSVRLSRDLHAEVVALAKADDRSITQMTEWLLGQALFITRMRRESRAPGVWYDVYNSAEARAAQEADRRGVDAGDWSNNREIYEAAMDAAVHRLLQLLPGEFDLERESGGAIKARFEHALASEHYRRKGPQPGEGLIASEKKDDAA